MEKNKIKILVKVLFVLVVLTFSFFLIKTIVECISIYNDVATSFPWYTPIVINSLIFTIPLIFEFLLLVYFYTRSKK